MSRVVEIVCADGVKRVSAHSVFGPFAVTPSTNPVGAWWTLTHLPTGLSVGRAWRDPDRAMRWGQSIFWRVLLNEGHRLALDSNDPAIVVATMRKYVGEIPTRYKPDIEETGGATAKNRKELEEARKPKRLIL